LGADRGDGFGAVGVHGPSLGEACEADEVFVELSAVGGVVHFWVELHGIEIAGCVGGDRVGRVGGGAVDLKAGGDFADVIAVAHPDLLVALREPALKQRELSSGCDIGAAKLCSAAAPGDFTALNHAAKLLHHGLLAIADAEHGHAEVVDGHGRQRRAVAGYSIWATGENHGFGGELAQEGVCHALERVDFTIDAELAQAAGNQLGYLTAKIDDQEFFGGAVLGALGHGAWLISRHGEGKGRIMQGCNVADAMQRGENRLQPVSGCGS